MGIAELVTGECDICILSGKLRWNGNVLEQEYCTQHYKNGKLISDVVRAWVPVPTVESTSAER